MISPRLRSSDSRASLRLAPGCLAMGVVSLPMHPAASSLALPIWPSTLAASALRLASSTKLSST